MNNLGNAKVNETHICVLRRVENEDRVKVDYVELIFKYQEQLDELERMANNDNRTIVELYDYMKNSPLRVLEQDFNFCPFLDGTYQWITRVPKILYTDYQSKLAEFDKDRNDEGRIQYEKTIKKKYIENLKSHVLPYMMKEAYDMLAKDPTVVAYSHRKVGWSFPSFNLNHDLRVVYKTNFGFGMSSFFYTQIFYKGIGILPYSDWVHYRYANSSDIIRFTRKHLLENKEWEKAINITADIYNYAVSKPDDFVKHFILNEVEEMVAGLESILNSTVRYKVLYSYFDPKRALFLEGDDLVRFKGEKISGALLFLDQLMTLVPICGDVSSYIHRIMNCNLSVVHELSSVIKAKNVTLQKLVKEIEVLQPQWDKLKEKDDEYGELKDKIQETIKSEADFKDKGIWEIIQERDNRFSKTYPEYKDFKKEYDRMKNRYCGVCSLRDNTLSLIKELQSYLDKIEDHKNYMIENNIAA